MAAFKSWDDCVRIAEKIVEVAPKNSFGWIHRSFALHELKRTQEARALLLPAAHRFPKQDIICYNLACYECQLGNTEAAREWLKKSMQLKKPGIIKARALSDEDLKPMWAEIERMQIPVKQRGTDTPPGVE